MTRRDGAVPASALPTTPRRLVVYSVFDKDGQVDDFVLYSLAALREHASRILVVVNGTLTAESLRMLESAADEVLLRANEGFDIGAHRHALRHLGGSLAEFDEVVLTNDTWYGPVRPWAPVFARMDRSACHFWGLTDHAAIRPNPLTRRGVAPYHLQSYWIAVRRPMFMSEAWRRYWERLPPLDSYVDAVLEHELRFTDVFTAAGWVAAAAFPVEEFDTENPSLYEAESLVDRGCPALKRRPLFHWPPLLDSYGAVGAWTLESVAARGYPIDMILKNLARTVPPKAMNVDVGLLTVLPPDGPAPAPSPPSAAPRVLVIVHSDGAPVDDVLRRADAIPGGHDLVVTVPDSAAQAALTADLARQRPSGANVDVRIVPADTSDESAFLVGCRDVLLSDEHDLVVRLRSFRADGSGASRHVLDHGYDNLLADGEYFSAVLSLFLDEPGLGLVYPPMLHIGHATLGKGWGTLLPTFTMVARRLGITVPLDGVSPLAPLGGMFVARPAALRLLLDSDWSYEEFEETAELSGAVERMWSYAAGQLGFHTRTIASRAYISVSHPLLEFELDEMSSTIPGRSFEKIDFLRHSGWIGSGTAGNLLRMYLRRRHAWVVRWARRLADPSRLPARVLRRDLALRRRRGD
jgi:rhamnosyltransferase